MSARLKTTFATHYLLHIAVAQTSRASRVLSVKDITSLYGVLYLRIVLIDHWLMLDNHNSHSIMSSVTGKQIENPLLSRYPAQPSRSSKPLEPTTHHNVPKISSSFASNPPPRRSYDDGLIFPLPESKATKIADADAATPAVPKPMYSTEGCWVRVSGLMTGDHLDAAMQHLQKYGFIKQRLGNISPTCNIIVVQYSSQFEAMAASASTFIPLTPYFYVAVQRLEDSDPVLQGLLAGSPTENIWGVPRKAEGEKDRVLDESDIFLCAPPKKEITERGFFESIACWLLSITDWWITGLKADRDALLATSHLSITSRPP